MNINYFILIFELQRVCQGILYKAVQKANISVH